MTVAHAFELWVFPSTLWFLCFFYFLKILACKCASCWVCRLLKYRWDKRFKHFQIQNWKFKTYPFKKIKHISEDLNSWFVNPSFFHHNKFKSYLLLIRNTLNSCDLSCIDNSYSSFIIDHHGLKFSVRLFKLCIGRIYQSFISCKETYIRKQQTYCISLNSFRENIFFLNL